MLGSRKERVARLEDRPTKPLLVVWVEGDFNENGRAEFADFLLLAKNLGHPDTPAAAIPEAECFSLLVISWQA